MICDYLFIFTLTFFFHLNNNIFVANKIEYFSYFGEPHIQWRTHIIVTFIDNTVKYKTFHTWKLWMPGLHILTNCFFNINIQKWIIHTNIRTIKISGNEFFALYGIWASAKPELPMEHADTSLLIASNHEIDPQEIYKILEIPEFWSNKDMKQWKQYYIALYDFTVPKFCHYQIWRC